MIFTKIFSKLFKTLVSKILNTIKWIHRGCKSIGVRIKLSTLKALYKCKGKTMVIDKDTGELVDLSYTEKVNAVRREALKSIKLKEEKLKNTETELAMNSDDEPFIRVRPKKVKHIEKVNKYKTTLEEIIDGATDDPEVIIDFNDIEKLLLEDPRLVSNPGDLINRENDGSVFTHAAMIGAKALDAATKNRKKEKRAATLQKREELNKKKEKEKQLDNVEKLINPKGSKGKKLEGNFKDIGSFINYLHWDPNAFYTRLSDLKKGGIVNPAISILDQINSKPNFYRDLFPQYIQESYFRALGHVGAPVTLRADLKNKQKEFNEAFIKNQKYIRSTVTSRQLRIAPISERMTPYSTEGNTLIKEVNTPTTKSKLVNKNLREVFDSNGEKVIIPEVTLTDGTIAQVIEPELSVTNKAKVYYRSFKDVLTGNIAKESMLNPESKTFIPLSLSKDAKILKNELEYKRTVNPFDSTRESDFHDRWELTKSYEDEQLILDDFEKANHYEGGFDTPKEGERTLLLQQPDSFSDPESDTEDEQDKDEIVMFDNRT